MAGFLQKVLAYIKWHYTDVTLRRSDKQVEREKFLFWCIPWNRWMMVPPAVLIQLCLGSLYSWSVYNVPIEEVRKCLHVRFTRLRSEVYSSLPSYTIAWVRAGDTHAPPLRLLPLTERSRA